MRLNCRLLWAAAMLMGTPHAATAATQSPVGEFLRRSGIKAGLAVHVNCPDGRTAVELARRGKFLIHAITPDARTVAKARADIQSAGLYGQASVEQLPLGQLPYADNLVNLLIAEDLGACLKAGLTIKEIMRAVCPKGMAFIGGGSITEAALKAKLAEAGSKEPEIIKAGGVWARVPKPRPAEMDEWQQYMHGSDRNPVSHDTAAGIPHGLRWTTGPQWPKGPVQQPGTYSILSANGRVFYVTSSTFSNVRASRKGFEPKVSTTPQNQMYLLARDAYNGLFCWERHWEDPAIIKTIQTMYLKLVYRLTPVPLVAEGERVYAGGLELNKVTTLDAATGRTLGAVDMGCSVLELARHGGKLIARTPRQLALVDTDNSRLTWAKDLQAGEMVIGGRDVFFLTGQKAPHELVCLDLADGGAKWRVSTAAWYTPPRPRGRRKVTRNLFLRLYQDGVLTLDDWTTGQMHVLSAADGKHLWNTPARAAFRQQTPPFYIDGLIWLPRFSPAKIAAGRRGSRPSIWQGHDPQTGNVRKRVEGPPPQGGCGIVTATDRCIVYNRQAGFLDLKTGSFHKFWAMRGPCNIHSVLANGLWYNPPHACRCTKVTVRGFSAFSPDQAAWPAPKARESADRLVKGPAYGQAPKAAAAASDWPTLRHDPARSGATQVALPTDLKGIWTVKLAGPPAGALKEDLTLNQAYGDPVTPPVIANGRVYLALPNSHEVIALDAADGSERWRFTAGGMVDSPPTIAEGWCVFGCRNGWLYCLRADDGKLAWRFRVAPLERRIVAYGQMESPWRASGSALVADGVVCTSAGRSPNIDGGYSVCGVDLKTGKLLWQNRVTAFWGMCAPVMVGDGKAVYVGGNVNTRPLAYDPKTGKRVKNRPVLVGGAVSGLLSGYWRRIPSSAHCYQYAWQYTDARGHLLVFDDKNIFGYREIKSRGKGKCLRADMPPCELFGRTRSVSGTKSLASWTWPVPEPAQVEAMLLAGKTLFVAGPLDKVDPKEARLWAVSADDGRKLTERKLDVPPVFDGLAAAGGRLYVSTQDGKLLCFGKK